MLYSLEPHQSNVWPSILLFTQKFKFQHIFSSFVFQVNHTHTRHKRDITIAQLNILYASPSSVEVKSYVALLWVRCTTLLGRKISAKLQKNKQGKSIVHVQTIWWRQVDGVCLWGDQYCNNNYLIPILCTVTVLRCTQPMLLLFYFQRQMYIKKYDVFYHFINAYTVYINKINMTFTMHQAKMYIEWNWLVFY